MFYNMKAYRCTYYVNSFHFLAVFYVFKLVNSVNVQTTDRSRRNIINALSEDDGLHCQFLLPRYEYKIPNPKFASGLDDDTSN